MAFRKALISQCKRDRALFIAPIAVALGLLFFVAQHKAVFAAAWRSPLSVLSDRSPGKRSAGALYNTKPERVLAEARLKPVRDNFPQERVLAASRVRLSPFDEFVPEAAPAGLFPEEEPIIDGFAPVDLDLPSVIPPIQPLFRGVAPGSTPEAEPTQTEPTPEQTSPVPEPTTWIMQIAGLFLIAGLMRARNRKSRLALPAAALLTRG